MCSCLLCWVAGGHAGTARGGGLATGRPASPPAAFPNPGQHIDVAGRHQSVDTDGEHAPGEQPPEPQLPLEPPTERSAQSESDESRCESTFFRIFRIGVSVSFR
jgi:hypothetical protein